MPRRPVKSIAVFTFLVLLVATAAGCSSKTAADNAASGGNTLTVGWDGATVPNNLAPVDPVKTPWFYNRAGILEALVDVDFTGKLQPGVAASWKQTSPTAWSITLKSGVKFHDGTPVNAAAIKFVLDRFAAGSKAIPIASVEASGDGEVVITASKPVLNMPALLATPQTVVYAQSSMQGDKFVQPVGTGPYVFVYYDSGTGIVTCKANEDYWNGKPQIDTIINKYIPDNQARIMALQSGEVDFIRTVSAESAKMLAANPDLEVVSDNVSRNRQIVFNTEKAPLNELAVRQAISYAIDRKAIITSVLGGFGDPAVGFFPPNLSSWGNPNLKGYGYDKDKASSLLDEAGWKDTDNDGVRDKNGKKLELLLETYPDRPELAGVAQVVQAQLKAVGIKVTIEIKEYSATENSLKARTFEMVLMARGLAFTPDPLIALNDFTSKPTAAWSPVYSNAKVDELMTQASQTTDPQKQQELINEVQSIIEQDAPAVFLNYYVEIDAYKKGLQNFKIHPSEVHMFTEKLSKQAEQANK
jgi:peptide/nickel transport system substrate-binding protein